VNNLNPHNDVILNVFQYPCDYDTETEISSALYQVQGDEIYRM